MRRANDADRIEKAFAIVADQFRYKDKLQREDDAFAFQKQSRLEDVNFRQSEAEKAQEHFIQEHDINLKQLDLAQQREKFEEGRDLVLSGKDAAQRFPRISDRINKNSQYKMSDLVSMENAYLGELQRDFNSMALSERYKTEKSKAEFNQLLGNISGVHGTNPPTLPEPARKDPLHFSGNRRPDFGLTGALENIVNPPVISPEAAATYRKSVVAGGEKTIAATKSVLGMIQDAYNSPNGFTPDARLSAVTSSLYTTLGKYLAQPEFQNNLEAKTAFESLAGLRQSNAQILQTQKSADAEADILSRGYVQGLNRTVEPGSSREDVDALYGR